MEKCYFMFKPGYTDEETVKDVLDAILDNGGEIVRTKKMMLSEKACREHYAHIVDVVVDGKPVYPKLEAYMLSGPVIGCEVQGQVGLIANLRSLMGSTKNPCDGTLRARYTKRVPEEDRVTKNGFHCSDSVETGEEEVDRFFNRADELGIVDLTDEKSR